MLLKQCVSCQTRKPLKQHVTIKSIISLGSHINNTSHWSHGLLTIVYGINTRLLVVTKTTPYQVMFGQAPYLLTPVADSNDDFNDYVNNIDEDIIQLVQQLSDDAVASSLTDIL
ncbi:unnamed protein product [Rotaria sp. Silwood1]|nr:unnamed protein product [Rotaria sp. Silwood1]CAF4590438.1 unnamed protein product [Rotaria sp. Silwood1]CAF4677460.1 unnamed protein product [Rotaria sp. Silwood1]CAF4981619.1 unnamed protein product [Rotaria sp. Silwood1]